MKKLPLIKNNIEENDLKDVIKHLNGDDPILTNGPKVREFEKKWSEWLGVKYSVFVNSGSSANLLSMSILKTLYPQGGEIIVPTLTWISDISSVIQNGFKPVFCDIDMQTLSMSTDEVKNAITKDTRAVFLTHAQGFNGLTNELIDLLRQKNIHLIEDVCESHGATHCNSKLGTYGFISNFSYYYAHHMSTIEGGMICTDNQDVYEIARSMRSHGLVREFDNKKLKDKWISANKDLNPEFIFAYPAYNVRNNEIGAIIGLNQLSRLDAMIEARNINHKYFIDNLDSEKYFTDFKMLGSSNYAFNLILKKKDDKLFKKLTSLLDDNEIEYRRGSAGGGNQLRQPYLKNIVPDKHYLKFRNTEHIHFYGMYIGNYPTLSKDNIDLIIKTVNCV